MSKTTPNSTNKTNWFFIVIFLFYLTTGSHVSFAEIKDGPIAWAKLSNQVNALLQQGKYAELEKMAMEFRKNKTRFPDGSWKLGRFYDALEKTGRNSTEWDEVFRKLKEWRERYPESITTRVATAGNYISFAWVERGNGYSNTVTEEGWKLMRERLARAYDFVKDRPKKTSGDCPRRYAILLRLGRAQNWNNEKYEAAFQEAISFEPAYNIYYIEKAMNLMPRWGGEEGDWQKFAYEATRLTPEGMGIYTRILIFMWYSDEFKAFREPDISWKRMKQGFLETERNYKNSNHNLNLFCRFARIAGDKETARDLLRRIGDSPYIQVWDGRSNYEECRIWANKRP